MKKIIIKLDLCYNEDTIKNDKRGRIVSVERIKAGFTEEIILKLKLEVLVEFYWTGTLSIGIIGKHSFGIWIFKDEHDRRRRQGNMLRSLVFILSQQETIKEF